MLKIIFFSSILLSISGHSNAEENSVTSNEIPQPTIEVADIQTDAWYLAAGQANIDRQVATNECIDSSATSLYFGYEGQDGHFIYGAGLSALLYGDNCRFRQNVEDGFGDRSSASSSASAFGLYGELGYSFVLQPKKVHFDLTAGLEQLFASERSISNCSNCYSEDIDVDAGLYVRPKIKFIGDNGFTFSIAYHYYPSSDINNSISLQFGMTTDKF